jgi:RNA polymerase sigma-70 factor (ECF subfamily)
VVAAGDQAAAEAREPLELLCAAYWRPIFAYLRRHGADHEHALDLTQGFFAVLIEKNYVGDARRERGRFRTFLLTALQHFAANEADRERALKRGGGTVTVPLDGLGEDGLERIEPAHGETPEKIYDRQWARTLIEAGLARLREEMGASERVRRFERLVPFLLGENDTGFRQAAADLGMRENAVKVAAHRLRQRLRALLREEVARTVADPDQVDDELRHLLASLAA